MVNKNCQLQFKMIEATLKDYPTIQNMARFYVYEMSRSCGFISDEWACPADGLYESYDFKIYFDDPTRKAFLIKAGDELAGFVLLNKIGTQSQIDWNMGEFFILAKFQGKGIGNQAASDVWETHPGIWEVSVIPENKPALAFWRNIISTFTNGHYTEVLKEIDNDKHQPTRYILSFDTRLLSSIVDTKDSSNITVSFVDEVSEAIEQRMTKDLIDDESSHGIDVNYKQFSLLLANEKNEVLGVLNAFTAFAEIYIDDLWVNQSHRGKGYGRKLLQALEGNFKGQGFNNMNLCTSAFQAPEFYKKCGFTIEFTRVNKIHPLLSKTFFVKFFNEEKQTQGLLSERHH